MSKPATSVRRVQHLDRIAARFDRVDLAFGVNYERDPPRNGVFRDVHSVFLGDFPVDKIAEQGKRETKLFGKGLLRWTVIGADGEYLRSGLLELLHTRLVRFHLGRSTTGERRWKERQYNGALTDEVREVNGTAIGRRKREIRHLVADLQRSRRRSLGEQTEADGTRNSDRSGDSHTHLLNLTLARFTSCVVQRPSPELAGKLSTDRSPEDMRKLYIRKRC